MKKRIVVLGIVSALALLVPITSCSASSYSKSIFSRPKVTQSPTPTQSAVETATPANVVVSTIPSGIGPQSRYTVQAQPKPGSCKYRFTADKQPLPDPICTPGATNPRVTQANLATTICRSGYTASIRPSTSITSREKVLNAASYGNIKSLKTQEYDHLISLQLGGDPNDSRNLWVEPESPGHVGNSVNNPKDSIENKLNDAICKGKVTLVQAQVAIATDWTTALAKLGLK